MRNLISNELGMGYNWLGRPHPSNQSAPQKKPFEPTALWKIISGIKHMTLFSIYLITNFYFSGYFQSPQVVQQKLVGNILDKLKCSCEHWLHNSKSRQKIKQHKVTDA